LFCPKCGIKLSGNEVICPACRYQLAEFHPLDQPPLTDIPPVTPAQKPPVIPIENYKQPLPGFRRQKPDKGVMSKGTIVIIILLCVLVIGCGIMLFLQYNENIDIKSLRGIMPAKEQVNNNESTANCPTRYYVVQSFSVIGNRWTAIVSGVVVSKAAYNNEEGAENQYKKAIMVKYPKMWNAFLGSIIVHQYSTFTDAENAHSSLIKTYNAHNYDILDVNFGY
jgi:hypothetical protein